MFNEFSIIGTQVELSKLLKLQALAVDVKQMGAFKSHSKRSGEHRSVFRGQGREFIEMKKYQAGDDVRQIDWRLTAKKQTPYVRVMEEDRHAEQAIWLDLTASSYFGTHTCFKSVLACYWASFLVWRFLQLGHPLRLFVRVGNWQQERKLTNVKQGAEACKIIADAHAYLAENFQHLEDTKLPILPVHWHGKPNLWFISDMQQYSVTDIRQSVSGDKITSLTLLKPSDPFDSSLPTAGLLPVKSNSNTNWINTNNDSFRTSYKQAYQQKLDALTELAWQNRGHFINHFTDQFVWQEVQAWPLYH